MLFQWYHPFWVSAAVKARNPISQKHSTRLDLMRDLYSQAGVAKIKTVLKMLLKQAIRHLSFHAFAVIDRSVIVGPMQRTVPLHVHGNWQDGIRSCQPAMPINQMILE